VVGGKVTIVVERLGPGIDQEAVSQLEAQQAAGLKEFAEKLHAGQLSPEESKLALVVLGLSAAIDPTYGRALGVRYIDREAGSGKRKYRLVALDAAGRSGAVLESSEVDPARATTLPERPGNLEAKSGADGALLYWTDAVQNEVSPVVAYYVERSVAGGKAEPLTTKPIILSAKRDAKLPAFADSKAPREAELTYQVSSVDLFGRRSEPVTFKLFLPDLQALLPPESVTATAEANKVRVAWRPSKNPHTAGYVIERAYLHSGPYEALTPKGVPRNSSSYEDTDVRGGTAYYYRVRSFGPRGDMGDPSRASLAQPRNREAPPQVTGLKADAGRSRVRLTWEPVNFPVAGYVVQRRAEEATDWAQLNSSVTPEPLYDDYFGLNTFGKFSYRIVAVAFDNQEGKPSAPVEVTLEDNSSPAAPYITGASGADGKVTLSFTPALPEEKTHQFFVLRGGSPDDPGLVIGEPLPATARQFVDTHVEAGTDYWYRLVALDSKGNRSDPSRDVIVRVGSPPLPTPPVPTVEFLSKPFGHVKVSFATPPAGLTVFLQRRTEAENVWLSLAGPLTGTEALDANPPAKGKVSYRIVYQAANGAQSPPSEAVEVSRSGSDGSR
jgi:hypothetical protein